MVYSYKLGGTFNTHNQTFMRQHRDESIFSSPVMAGRLVCRRLFSAEETDRSQKTDTDGSTQTHTDSHTDSVTITEENMTLGAAQLMREAEEGGEQLA